jgi:hypothetical protein
MKRIALALVLVFAATSLFAGGKECNIKQHAAKSVELTGTLVRVADGDHTKTVFRVANSNQSYTVCEKTKSSVLKLGNDGKDTLWIKGKVASCSDSNSEELVIETAKKV